MKITKVTSVLIVEDVRKESAVWVSLGFKIVVEVPHGETVGFAVLSNGGCEIMFQTPASLKDDLPAVVQHLKGQRHYLFADVESLQAAKKRCRMVKSLFQNETLFMGQKNFLLEHLPVRLSGLPKKFRQTANLLNLPTRD